MDNDSENGVKL